MKAYKFTGILIYILALFQVAFSQEKPTSNSNQSKKIYSFGLIADIQYADADKKGNRDYRNTLNKLETCVNEFNSHELAFVINLGDMVDHQYVSYDKPMTILGNLKAPLYNVIGNHDFDVDDQYRGQVREHLKNKNGYFEFERDNMAFIVLDGTDLSTFAFPQGSGYYNKALATYEEIKKKGLNNAFMWNGGIGNKQLNWLETRLNEADKLKNKVVIFCHWPLLPENGTQLWNNREVLNLINNHPCVVAWIAGHHHAGGYEKTGNIHHLIIKGMVEARSETSCGVMEVYPDKLFLKGFGDQNDQIMKIPR